jgi:hypothetical protein
LQLDVPVFEVGQWYLAARNRTAHEVAGRKDLKLAILVANARLAPAAEQFLETVHAKSRLKVAGPVTGPWSLVHNAEEQA